MDSENKDSLPQDFKDERTEGILKENTQTDKEKERENLGKIAIQTDLDPKAKDQDKRKFREVKTLGTGSTDFLCTRFDPDDTLLAVGTSDGHVQIYSLGSTDKMLHHLKASDSGMPITCLRWRPHSGTSKTKHTLVSVGADGGIYHWHVSSGKLLYHMTEKENNIMCMDYNNDGTQFATAGKDRTIRIYDESTKSIVTELAAGMWQYPGHSNRIFSVKFHPDDPNIMLSCGWDNTIYFWDIRDAKSFASCYGPAVTGDSLDIKGNYILTGSWRNKEQLELWDYGQRKKVNTISWDGHYNVENAYIYGCQFSKRDDESILAGCSNLNEVRVFDRLNNNKPVVRIHEMRRAVYSVDWANTSDMFAFCGGDGRAHVIGISKN